MNELEEETIGPGADLAISLTGVLIALLVGSFFYWDRLVVSKDELKELLRIETNNLDASTLDLAAVSAILAQTQTKLDEEIKLTSQLMEQLYDAERKLEGLLPSTKGRDDTVIEAATLKSENRDMAAKIIELGRMNDNLNAVVKNMTKELNQLRSQIAGTDQTMIDDLIKKIENLELKKLSDQPPFININDAWQQLFEIGSATIDQKFKLLLETEIANEIAELTMKYGAQVVEIVGHTDEIPIARSQKNHIDSRLLAVLNNNASLNEIVPRSNMDLGMARAVAVALVLGGDPKLSALTIRPMSAGQSTLPNDQIAPYSVFSNGPDAERRRIEIRVRRRSETQTIK